MKIEIDCEIQEGYEATGEYRFAKYGDIVSSRNMGATEWTNKKESVDRFIILRKTAPKMRPMTAYDIACLPRGTAFVDDDGSTYCPTITQNADGYTEINGSNVINYNGYILPDSTELRPFTKEVS